MAAIINADTAQKKLLFLIKGMKIMDSTILNKERKLGIKLLPDAISMNPIGCSSPMTRMIIRCTKNKMQYYFQSNSCAVRSLMQDTENMANTENININTPK
jgi:hypothetical protein